MVDFFLNGLCMHCHLAKSDLLDLMDFNQKTEEAWKAKHKELEIDFNEVLAAQPEEIHADIIESYAWDLHLNQDKYPNLHRQSLLITIFNFIEHKLDELCEILYESVNSSLKLKDIYGKGVERARLFLVKVAKFDFSNFGSELSEISGVNKLRNIIVHKGGLLPESPESLEVKFVSKSEHLSGVESGSINIHVEFIPHFINVLMSFFEKLDIEVTNHMNRYVPD